jgi:hypothetical protein
MNIPTKYKIGTTSTLMSAELNSLANNSLVIGNPYNNITEGYPFCDVELLVTFNVAPAANTAICLWFISSLDGSTYEDGSNTVTPTALPSAVFSLRPVIISQRINRRIWLPWGTFKPLIKNDGTGQALANSGNLLTIRPVTYESVV